MINDEIIKSKGEVGTVQFTLYEDIPTAGGTANTSNITGATIIFSLFNNPTELSLIYRGNGTITDAANGVFTVPITADATKQRGQLYYTLWATYANGNRVFWGDGIFTVKDNGGYA